LLESELFAMSAAHSPERLRLGVVVRTGEVAHCFSMKSGYAGRFADTPAARTVRRQFLSRCGHQPIKANVRIITPPSNLDERSSKVCSAKICSIV